MYVLIGDELINIYHINMISKKLSIEVINTALSTGADFAEIYYEDSKTKAITVENGKVESVASGRVNGVGIRIEKETKSVYGHTNDISKNSLVKLASDLSKSFDSKRLIEVKSFKKQRIKLVNKPIKSYADVKDEDIINLLKRTNKANRDVDTRITRTETIFLTKISDVVILNSNQKEYKDHREYGRLIISSTAFDNGKIETRFDGPGTKKGFDYFTDELDSIALAKKNGEKVIMMLDAKECPSGKFPVIIGSGWGGVIFHEACGHQMEATSVAKGLSVYAPLYGQKIGSDLVTAYDDGTLPNEWGSNNIDDEGYPTQRNKLIDKGVLCGYLVDPFNSRRMKDFKPTGCSRRESYKYAPTSRMSNTFIANGTSTKEEIIANTKLAVYAVGFKGGSVDPSTGEFNFGCDEAYLVKDGKICEPLRGATLIGKATEVLHHIDMVGNDLAMGQGNCGSSSGYVQTNVGQPTIRIDEITVGGRGGSIYEL